MQDYLNYLVELDNPDVVSALDELSLWSAPFGIMLLDKVGMKPGMTVLDIGFGNGFPLIELSQRLGKSSTVYGIDPWAAAIERAKKKIKTFGIQNVKPVQGDAAAMAFEDNMFDLIVSNTGVNNFKDVEAVFRESFRVTKPGGRIALTTNPVGHMQEFYDILAETVAELKLDHLREPLETQRRHRHPGEDIMHLLHDAGFDPGEMTHRDYVMRFANGTAFLEHYFVKIGFMEGWKSIFAADILAEVFCRVEEKMNRIACEIGEFKVTIPIIYIEAGKP